MLMLKQWLRAWRGGELGLLCLALSLAIASVSGIAGFSERLQGAMAVQSRQFLAADNVLTSARPIEQGWLDQARQLGLNSAQIAAFRSMVFAGDKMLLVSLRAVSSDYPLLGQVRLANGVFEPGAAVDGGPGPGEIWLDSRAFALLGIRPGVQVEVGEHRLLASRVLVDEPDRSSALNIYGPRALMNLADLPATEVVQVGSVVDYRYLFSGDQRAFDSFQKSVARPLKPGQAWLNLDDNQPALADALARAEQYLLLTASLALALAGAAIALAAQRYGQRNVDAVALMKTLGASRRYILLFYLRQLGLVFALAAIIGAVAGEVVQQVLLASLAQIIDGELPQASWRPLLMALGSAGVCLLSFAMPPIVRLSRVSPAHVLRSDHHFGGGWLGAVAIGSAGLALLMYWYSGSLILVIVLMTGSAGLLLATATVVLGALALVRRVSLAMPGSGQRLAVSSIFRRRYANAFQTASIALALMVLISLVLLRELLLKDWQQQVAQDSPNYFLINIAADELASLEGFLAQRGIAHAGLYPMVRGRLSHINGRELAAIENLDIRNSGVDRELNLSWAAELPEANQLIAGQWWTPTDSAAPAPVSVEQEVADQLNLEVGSLLTFNIGGRELEARVGSLRQLDWASMRPNFYFLFPEAALAGYAGSFITSFYLPPSQRPLLVELLSQYPTLSLIEIDAVLQQVQAVIAQLSRALAVILGLVLACGLLISSANVLLSFQSRSQENALLRTLGASNGFLRAILVGEFALLGALAGGVAGLGANLCLVLIQYGVLQSPVVFYWLAVPVGAGAAALMLAILVFAQSRPMLRSSAMALLRAS